VDADANAQDEQWVALTRNLTLLSARGYETAGSGEEYMMVCIRIYPSLSLENPSLKS
jgi:hypothetical protein